MKTTKKILLNKRGINLYHAENKREKVCRSCALAVVNSLPLILVICFALSARTPLSHTVPTPLEAFSKIEFFEKVREQSQVAVDDQSHISELRKNFLTNERIKSEDLREQFKHSGLSHLLALSGGQTGPAASAIASFFMLFLLWPLRFLLSINICRWVNLIRGVSSVIQTTTLVFLVGLYQSTGALNRTLAEQITHSARTGSLLSIRHERIRTALLPSIHRAVPWLLGWLWHKNPSTDLSFLLSALGASTSSTVSALSGRLNDETLINKKNSKGQFNRIFGPIIKLTTVIISGAACSALMCLLTWPLWPPDHLLDKVAANLLAGPCVLYLITPATLCVCLGVVVGAPNLTSCAHALLDFGLGCLMSLAHVFSHSALMESIQGPTTTVLTFAGLQQPRTLAVTLINLEIIGLAIVGEYIRLKPPRPTTPPARQD